MSTKIDDKSTASWLRRAISEVATVSGKHSDADTVIDSRVGNSEIGWVPHQVWLRHIERPRRLRQRDIQSN